MRYLLIEELRSGTPVELSKISDERVILGREAGDGILAVPSQAVSRQHGTLLHVRNHWIYTDNGSTNGSWVNGVVVKEGQRRVLRSGDILQLADLILRVSEVLDGGGHDVVTVPSATTRSLLVFSRDVLVDEYPVPEYGRALVIGGPQSDLEIEGQLQNSSSLVIERKGMETTAFAMNPSMHPFLNGNEIKDQCVIRDGDEIALSYYSILFNDPVNLERNSTLSSGGSTSASSREWGGALRAGGARDGGYLEKASTSSVFGRPPMDQELTADETVLMDPSEVEARIGKRDAHPGARFTLEEPSGPAFSFDSLEEKIVVIVGFGLLLALMVLLVLWLFM